ncbi:MAG: MotA/TolQ/ExbB proton channel family protein [Candidatus Loosdrechtia sp.]|uniref:MotA/TolQ/ExbB proton channel family protein n=1 Tax=Candidatus Loosdrechtia sp. TaxID=3101272 RepID=UPI003A72E4DB|nr:MAG: MotA/TolQ/ExbB proton channel family protein [Candidatus Jettenia sp. AMX2]
MNIFAGLQTFIYVISSAIFFPVVAGLVLLVFWVVIFFGGFLNEYLERRRGISYQVTKYKGTIASSVEQSAASDVFDVNLERLLQSAELELIKSLDKIRFAIRVGPTLGLMGTLIPMGIALSALAQGDMPKMAGSRLRHLPQPSLVLHAVWLHI